MDISRNSLLWFISVCCLTSKNGMSFSKVEESTPTAWIGGAGCEPGQSVWQCITSTFKAATRPHIETKCVLNSNLYDITASEFAAGSERFLLRHSPIEECHKLLFCCSHASGTLFHITRL